MNKVSIRKLGSGDEKDLKDLLDLYIDVFKEPNYQTNTNYLASLLSRDNIEFIAASQSAELLGGLTAYILPSIYGNYNELYIYDMAVSTAYQRQGIGTQLLDFLKEHSKTIGITDIFVQADAEDIHARNFYKKNGAIEEEVFHYNFKVK